MSQIDYQALRAKAEKATCGEWSLEYGEGRFDGDDALIHREVAGYIPICRIEGAHPESGFDEDFQMEQQANAEFIAAASPATVLALLDERERNQQYIKRRDQENEDIALTVGKLRVELEAAEKRIAELEAEPMAWRYRYVKKGITDSQGEPWVGDWKYVPTKEDCNDRQNYEIQALFTAPPVPLTPEGLIKAVRFYEQVKRENPPVETGAWKDAVDWVLKEACQAVNIGIKGE
ncbi:TPA: ead/Ea22-like family protein [Escherichia coli]|nr:ead/Ea22-like family protein [Escherichia coli]